MKLEVKGGPDRLGLGDVTQNFGLVSSKARAAGVRTVTCAESRLCSEHFAKQGEMTALCTEVVSVEM